MLIDINYDTKIAYFFPLRLRDIYCITSNGSTRGLVKDSNTTVSLWQISDSFNRWCLVVLDLFSRLNLSFVFLSFRRNVVIEAREAATAMEKVDVSLPLK